MRMYGSHPAVPVRVFAKGGRSADLPPLFLDKKMGCIRHFMQTSFARPYGIVMRG